MRTSLHWSPEAILEDFRQVALIAGTPIEGEIFIENLPAPHRPTSLPSGLTGVYAFSYNGQTLKVGKAGPKSKARFSSHHYSPQSSRSNLASCYCVAGRDSV
jgi:hypothetical protein